MAVLGSWATSAPSSSWVGLLVPLAMLRKGTFKPGTGGRGARGLLTLVLIGVGAALSLVSLGYDWVGADADMEGQKASIGLGMGDTTFGSTLVVLFAVSTLALAIGYYLHGGLRDAAPMVASATLYGSIMAMSLIAAIGLDDLGRTTGNLTAGHAHAEVEVFSGTWIAAASAVACLLGAYWAAYSNGRGVQSVSGGAALKRTAIENVSPTPPNAGSGMCATVRTRSVGNRRLVKTVDVRSSLGEIGDWPDATPGIGDRTRV